MDRPAEDLQLRRPVARGAAATDLHPVAAALAGLLAGVLVLAGCAGGDDDAPGGARTTATAPAAGPAADADGPSTADGTTAATVDEALLAEAHAHVADRLRPLVDRALDVPMAEFALAVDAACRAAATAGPDPDAIASDVAAAMPEGPDVPQWRGTALAVSAQYFFVGGCAVPDPAAVIDALAPHIMDGLTSG